MRPSSSVPAVALGTPTPDEAAICIFLRLGPRICSGNRNAVRNHLLTHETSGGRLKIVIAVDGSTASDAALHELRPWPKESEFSIVTAVDSFFFVRAPSLLDAADLRASSTAVLTGQPFENPRHAIQLLATE
jgi:hypothetical protein